MHPLPLLDDNTLLIDNSTLEAYTKCPRSYEYSKLRSFSSAKGSSPLKFGEAIHLALQCRFQLCKSGPVTPEVERRQLAILEEYWKTWSTPIGDHRTLGLACKAILDYNKEWPADPSIDILAGGVETPFAVPLGELEGGMKVVWTGRIDLTLRNSEGKLCILDHKTSSIGGEYALVDYHMSSQLMGYCYASKFKLAEQCLDATVDLLVLRKPAKTKGKGNEFTRKTFHFEPEQLQEWRINTLSIVDTLVKQHRQGYFPMHTPGRACVGKFGICQFMDVCTLTWTCRENYLQTGAYVIEPWSPLHDPSPIYTRVMALSDSEINPQRHEIESSASVGPNINDLLDVG